MDFMRIFSKYDVSSEIMMLGLGHSYDIAYENYETQKRTHVYYKCT